MKNTNITFKTGLVNFILLVVLCSLSMAAMPPDPDNPDIYWPDNVNLKYDGVTPIGDFIDPDNLAPPFDWPSFSQNPPEGCETGYAISYEDFIYEEEGESYCTKILREWEVMNWCTQETYTHIQVIMLMDPDIIEGQPCGG